MRLRFGPFNCLFKYTQVTDFYRCLLIKCGVAPTLLLLQAKLSGVDTEHLMVVQTSSPKRATFAIRGASKVN